MRLALCLPAVSFDPAWDMFCLKPFIKYCGETGINLSISMVGQRENIALVREKLLLDAPQDLDNFNIVEPWNGKLQYDYILWVDSDIKFTPQDFERLRNQNKDVVAGIYPIMQEQPDGSVTLKMSAIKMDGNRFDLTETELQNVIWTGFGFILFKKGVFENISRPWFETGRRKVLDQDRYVTEDTSLCLKAREAGFDIWVDPQLVLAHRKESYITPDDVRQCFQRSRGGI